VTTLNSNTFDSSVLKELLKRKPYTKSLNYAAWPSKKAAKKREEDNEQEEIERRKNEPVSQFDASGKAIPPEIAPSEADGFFWREFTTKCPNCNEVFTRLRGWVFCAMTPQGDMLIFCNVECCNQWEIAGDNTNNRRRAIRTQKAAKEKQGGQSPRQEKT
jgi:hypothetical protein